MTLQANHGSGPHHPLVLQDEMAAMSNLRGIQPTLGKKKWRLSPSRVASYQSTYRPRGSPM